MSFVSSFDDATSSGAGEEVSFSSAHLAHGKAKDESTIRQQLFTKTSEAKRWQDSVLHLSGIATSKDEALSVERSRSAKLALALEDAQEVAAAHKDECEQLHKDRRVAMQQVTMLQSELQTILGTCSGLENQVTQLENLLQQEREVFAKQGALQVEKARQEAALAGKRTEQQEHQILELRTNLQTAEAELHVAHSDCVKTLRYAESLHTSMAALAQESQRELDRSHYLQQEVQRLATACFDKQNKCNQQSEIIISQELKIQTLEAQLGQDCTAQLREVLERERTEKDFVHRQLRKCLGNFSQVCVRQQLFLSFVEEASVFLRQLVGDLENANQQLALVQSEGALIWEVTHKQRATDAAVLAAQLQQKQRELDFSLDKQLEYSQHLSKIKKGDETRDSVKELQYNRVRESEDAAALREAEEALQQAKDREEKSAMKIADMTAQLRERSAELADAQDRLSRAMQTAEILRLQLSELQQQDAEEERENQDITPTPHESHRPRDSLTCMPYAVTECGKESSPSPTLPATSTRSFSDFQGPHDAAQRTAGEEEKSEGIRGLPQLTEMQATKMRIRELEAGNIWLERERERLTDLLRASSLSRSPSTALSDFSDSSSASHAKSLHLVQAARKHAGDSDEKEQVLVDKGKEAVRRNSPTRGTTPLVPGDADVEAALDAAVEKAECRADAAVDALLMLKEALAALCRKVQALERQLVASQEAQYFCEEELERSCETVEQLRGELQQVLDGRRGHSLLGGVVAQEGSRGAGENIEEEIEEIVCDGVCATAEHLRRQLAELQLDHQRQSELNFDGQGRQAAEEGFSMQEREQGECNGGAWRNCGGRCDSAERLRHQLEVAEARCDDAELENEVLQRKLDLCKNELEAVRVKFRVPTNFFESDA